MLRLFCFALLCFVFRRYVFVETAALSSIVLRYAGASVATRAPFFFSFIYLEMSLFPSIFCTVSAFSLYGEYAYVLSFRMVFFYLVTKGCIFDISLCDNSINQSIIIKSNSEEPACLTYNIIISSSNSTIQ